MICEFKNSIKNIQILLKVLVILALLDLIATIYWVAAGLATEANPIMNFFLQYSFYSFAMAKLSLSFTGIFTLNLLKEKRQTLIFSLSAMLVIVYLGVVAWHTYGLVLLLIFNNGLI